MHIVLQVCYTMQYFQAVQIGKQRANKAQMILFDISGFAMLTLTTKKIDGKFVPVGEESFTAVIKTDDGFVVLLVDADGFTKAQTKALEKDLYCIKASAGIPGLDALKHSLPAACVAALFFVLTFCFHLACFITLTFILCLCPYFCEQQQCCCCC